MTQLQPKGVGQRAESKAREVTGNAIRWKKVVISCSPSALLNAQGIPHLQPTAYAPIVSYSVVWY